MNQAVQITFDCLPLRIVDRVDAPVDASAEHRARCQRIKQAMDSHGTARTYYLRDAHAVFHLANSDVVGMLRFEFEGTVTTDASDRKTQSVDLSVRLVGETCDWLTDPVVAWFHETVRRAVAVEFDRYIVSGDLARTVAQLDKTRAERAATGDPRGMYL